MKILYIITQADGGGAQQYVLALAKHFNGAIAAGDEASKLFEDAKKAGLAVYPLKHLKRNIHPWHDFLAIWEIQSLIKTLNPDIVHLNSTKAGFLGSVGAKLANWSQGMPRTGQQGWTGARVVFTAHGFRYLEPLSYSARAFYLAIEKVAGGFRDFIITVSDVDKQSALKNKLISPNKIAAIHNGIPPITFLSRDEARAKLNLPQDKFIFGAIANFYKTKGLDVLVEAVSKLDKETKSRCGFVIVGHGSEFGNLKLKIKNLGLESSFKLSGQIPEARTYLKAFDVFILPSRKEGFPFVILEAMQAGLPIIATQVGGVPEALGDAGILIEPENPQALADAISTILRYSNIADNLSQKAIKRSEEFTEEKMLEETKKVYLHTISTRKVVKNA